MDKRIGFFLLVCLAMLPVVLTGCAGGQVQKTVTVSILPEDSFARNLLDMVFSRYRGYTRAGFEEVVSRDFVPAREDFLNMVDGKSYSSRILGLNYLIENGLRAENRVVISFRWDKKEAPVVSGTVAQVSGRTEFTFKKTRSGWGLLQVNGDNPF